MKVLSNRYQLIYMLVMMFAMSHSVMAERSVLTGTIKASASHDDNLFLTNSAQRVVSSLVIEPGFEYEYSDLVWLTSFSGSLQSNNYSAKNLDGTDASLKANAALKKALDTYSVSTSYAKENNLGRRDVDFGLTQNRVDRTTLSIGPAYTRDLTERLSLTARYDFVDVEYDNRGGATNFISYVLGKTSFSLIYLLNERARFTSTLSRTDYESFDETSEYTLDTFSMGYLWFLSEVTSLDMSLGISQRDSISAGAPVIFFGTTITPLGIRSKSDGVLFGLSVKHGLTPNTKIELDLSRSDQTNSLGGLNVIDSISIGYKDDTDEVWGWSASVDYQDIASETIGITFTDRQTLSLSTKLTYKFDRRWYVIGEYRYFTREFSSQTTGSAPVSNRIGLTLSYSHELLGG